MQLECASQYHVLGLTSDLVPGIEHTTGSSVCAAFCLDSRKTYQIDTVRFENLISDQIYANRKKTRRVIGQGNP